MANERIKEALKENKLRQWELADLLGIAETTLCVRLRKELPENDKKEIIALIKKNRK